jgi:hypothetical protein
VSKANCISALTAPIISRREYKNMRLSILCVVTVLLGCTTLIPSYGGDDVAALSCRVFGGQVRIQADHKLLVASVYTSPGGQGIAVSRLDSAGAIDTQYGSVGNYAVDFQMNGATSVETIALDAHGSSLVTINAETGGDNLPYRFARVTSSGTTNPRHPGSAVRRQFRSGTPRANVSAIASCVRTRGSSPA